MLKGFLVAIATFSVCIIIAFLIEKYKKVIFKRNNRRKKTKTTSTVKPRSTTKIYYVVPKNKDGNNSRNASIPLEGAKLNDGIFKRVEK